MTPKLNDSAKPTLNDFVKNAVKLRIGRPDYKPRRLPPLADSICSTFAPDMGDSETSPTALLREEYNQIGRSTFKSSIFLIALPTLSGKPVGFAQAVQDVVSRHDILRLIMEKTDARFLSHIKKNSKIDDSFYALLGALWIQVGFNTETIVKFLRPIFEPLLAAAGNAFLGYDATISGNTAVASSTDSQIRIGKNLRVLLNVQKVGKILAAQKSPPAVSSSSDSSGFDASQETNEGPDDTWAEYQEKLVVEPPATFSPNLEVAPHSEIMGEDFHDLISIGLPPAESSPGLPLPLQGLRSLHRTSRCPRRGLRSRSGPSALLCF
ncbi:hypothetical protein DFH09DRAFT_119742 [Mycena vulgaris]|nr:hypothetical protein DFH09DRAFT_119742 [Mycena vulgaris]